ncbi:MAG: FKBP-type peptidyl-prolyl cis-trans isomerase [Isosphaeraceae bacterium]
MHVRHDLTGVALAALGLAVWGCGPPEVAPVAPPGIELSRITVHGDEEAAEAIGETGHMSAEPAEPAEPATPGRDSPPTGKGETMTKPSGLQYQTTHQGVGASVKPGQTVSVLYTGKLASTGKVFDSSPKSKPLEFVLGSPGMIPGFDEGVTGMKVKEHRKLTIPPTLGYGHEGSPPAIPPDSTLIFDIELLKVQ